MTGRNLDLYLLRTYDRSCKNVHFRCNDEIKWKVHKNDVSNLTVSWKTLYYNGSGRRRWTRTLNHTREVQARITKRNDSPILAMVRYTWNIPRVAITPVRYGGIIWNYCNAGLGFQACGCDIGKARALDATGAAVYPGITSRRISGTGRNSRDKVALENIREIWQSHFISAYARDLPREFLPCDYFAPIIQKALFYIHTCTISICSRIALMNNCQSHYS